MIPHPLAFLRWLLPLVAALASAGMVFAAQRKLGEADAARERATGSLYRTVQLAKAMAADPSHRISTVAKSPDEEARFMQQVRRAADESGARLQKCAFESSELLPEKELKRGPFDTDADEPIARLESVTCRATLVGSYLALRKFLDTMAESPRLVTCTDVEWAREGKQARLTVALTRYVTLAASEADGIDHP